MTVERAVGPKRPGPTRLCFGIAIGPFSYGHDPRVQDGRFPVAVLIACTDDPLAALDLPFALDPGHGPDYSAIGGRK